jgi:hypothetical protein
LLESPDSVAVNPEAVESCELWRECRKKIDG